MKVIMSGNEAIARGAYEGGVQFASAYPGTPSTEILENMPQYSEDVYSEWAPNEKVAAEAAIGASLAGVRSFCAMKHVGMNVAADPIFTVAYTGVTGGFVIVSADDPGQHSSQNEQDNRNYAKAARLLMLEPSSSQECKDFMKMAFELSERFDAPVLMHLTTRVCHSKGIVELGDRVEHEYVPYKKQITKYVSAPANAKKMRVNLEDKLAKMEEFANTVEINQPEYHDTKIGVVTSGISYQYAKETFGDNASYLKLGMTFPLPTNLIKEFCSKVDKVYVVEEMDPYLQEFLERHGIECVGKPTIPVFDELNTDLVREALTGEKPESYDSELKSVVRPPTLCAGCPHRGFFQAIKKKKGLMINGDIGCYTLAAGAPYNAMNSTVCMGASISVGHGAQQAFNRAGVKRKVVTVLGDSTFFHTGVESLINTVYNKSDTVNIILDNRITGMTGHQQNPGSGFTVKMEPAPIIDIEELVKALGIRHVKVIDPNDLAAVDAALDEFLPLKEPSVIITRWPCVLKKFSEADLEEFDGLFSTKDTVDPEKCIGCRACMGTGCPALIFEKEEKKVRINRADCVGCDVCMQVCPVDAITKETGR